MLCLPFARLERFKDTFQWKYGFSLTAHEIKIKFAAGSKEEAARWYKRLKAGCEVVLTHFSSYYNVGQLLCRSSYSKLNFATSRDNLACYSIRSLVKSQLRENARSLVLLPPLPVVAKPRQRDQDPKRH